MLSSYDICYNSVAEIHVLTLKEESYTQSIKALNQNSSLINLNVTDISEGEEDENVAKISTEKTLYKFDDGSDGTQKEYENALAELEDEDDVDLVFASISEKTLSTDVYKEVMNHCENMSKQSKGRIGFGAISDNDFTTPEEYKRFNGLVSDRFCLISPKEAVGAVIGKIGSLKYWESPTFKKISTEQLKETFSLSKQRELLKRGIIPIVNKKDSGDIVLKGITTDKEQLSVRRIADTAARGVKSISDLFIGKLNNESGRGSLKQKITEFLVQMHKNRLISIF